MKRNWFLIHGLEKEIKREKKFIDSLSKVFEDDYPEENPNVLNFGEALASEGDMEVICDLYMQELEFCNAMSNFARALVPCLRHRESFKLLHLLEEYLVPSIDWLETELYNITGNPIFKH